MYHICKISVSTFFRSYTVESNGNSVIRNLFKHSPSNPQLPSFRFIPFPPFLQNPTTLSFTCYEYNEKAEIPRISGYPRVVIFRTSGPSRNTRPSRLYRCNHLASHRDSTTFYTSVFQLYTSLPPSYSPSFVDADGNGGFVARRS